MPRPSMIVPASTTYMAMSLRVVAEKTGPAELVGPVAPVVADNEDGDVGYSDPEYDVQGAVRVGPGSDGRSPFASRRRARGA